MVNSVSFVSTGTFNHVFWGNLVENKGFLCLLIFLCMLDEGNLEDKSVPHYLSLESCTSSKIIGTTMDSI
jgi:hypothetical protein